MSLVLKDSSRGDYCPGGTIDSKLEGAEKSCLQKGNAIDGGRGKAANEVELLPHFQGVSLGKQGGLQINV